MRDLSSLLVEIDAEAGLAQRHLWLIALCDWIRGNEDSQEASVHRVHLFLDAVQARPEAQARLQAWWKKLVQTVDLTTLLADFGFAPRAAFTSELAERLRRKLLPGTPETIDASELFLLALPKASDARWIAALDASALARLADVLSDHHAVSAWHWEHVVLDAITFCASQISATGFAPELRLRMSEEARKSQPFHELVADVEALRAQVRRLARDAYAGSTELQAAAQQLRDRLEACRQAAATVYAHLEDNGISVGLVFRLRQLRERVLRIRELMDCLLSPSPTVSAARLIAHLVVVGRERSSVRALVASNSSLLAAKMAERSAETGEHYITRTRAEYQSMLRAAAGGGAATALTTWLKFLLGAAALGAFWGGVWSGAMYAASFMLIQLMHWTLATKQPAMTAHAMAAKLKDLSTGPAVEDFVDEVANLVRSQVAAVLGNVGMVTPCVLLISWLLFLASGHTMIDKVHAAEVFHTLSLLNPTTLMFAAFTGLLLFASSMIAGWAENWFVLHRLGSAMRYNPAITRVLGIRRAARWASFMRRNISGFASNISLGFMLGLVPPVLAFLGLGLQARHVTLSTGQLAAAAAAYGPDVWRMPELWWCVAAIPLIGALNLSVSFYFAFRLALRAHNVSGVDRARIRAAIWARWRQRALSFFIPA
jgi:site-specific recombinase